MSISLSAFGKTEDGRVATLYTLTNKIGASISVLDFGAHLVSVRVPDRNGQMADVCLGFDTLEEYDQKPCFVGGVLGRFSNRIAGAGFSLNGKEYTLFKNDGPNSLHGGREGFDKKWWRGQELEAEAEDAVIFTYVAHDGEEGYPGTVTFSIKYTFTDDSSLSIEYCAETDKTTLFNVTNHSYFNLNGHDAGSAMAHSLRVFADAYTPGDAEQIPTGEIEPVEGTPFDFQKEHVIGDRIDQTHPQLDAAGGYDHNYCLNGAGLRRLTSLMNVSMVVFCWRS